MVEKIGDGEVELDLLGDPLQPIRDPRGRPSYKKTKENQLLVISLRAANWTQEQIATFIGCDVKTLRKNFSRELDHGALFLDGMAMQVIVKKMLSGNLSAAREVREIAAAGNAPKGAAAQKKPEPLGKKERLLSEAHEAPKGWGDILPGIDRPN